MSTSPTSTAASLPGGVSSSLQDERDPFELAAEAAAVIRERSGIDTHDIALVLGSGWGGAAELIGETVAEIPAAEVPGFHAPAVAGHVPVMRSIRIHGSDDAAPSGAGAAASATGADAGAGATGADAGAGATGADAGAGATGADAGAGATDAGARAPKHALVLGSRTHFYEGKGVRAVAHGMRTAAAAGAKTVVLTNGCGGLNPKWRPGQVVLINDQINLTAASPIEGANFVDLTDLYSSRLRGLARDIDASLPEGVYAQFRGPHYETPAEVKMAGILGADLVGMSTTLEAIAARQSGMEILGLSLMTNLAAGISETPLSHEEVIEAGQEAAPRIAALLAQIVERIAAE